MPTSLLRPFLAATQAVMHCAAGRAHLTDVEGNVIVFGRGRSQRATLHDDSFRKAVHALTTSAKDDGLPLLRQVAGYARRFEPISPPCSVLLHCHGTTIAWVAYGAGGRSEDPS